VSTAVPLVQRLSGAGERIDRMTLRERVLVFAAGVALIYISWQTLLMDPLADRGRAAQHRLDESRARLLQMDATASAGNPRQQAAERRRALQQQLVSLDERLRDAAGGFVAPDRMADLLRDVLARQQGLRLVSLRNLPVENLGELAATAEAAVAAGSSAAPAAGGPAAASVVADASTPAGPFVHPVELVVEGDFAAIVAYLRALEALPWQVQWRKLDLAAGDYPNNRVRIELGTLGLTRDWLSV
jgi:MSHA biogenesis protein MshJ